MYIEFPKINMFCRGWALKDEVIIYKNKDYKISNIKKAIYKEKTYPQIEFFYGDEFVILQIDKNLRQKGKEAYEYITKHCGEPEKPVEHRMRCNVCGKIFSYTDADVRTSLNYSKQAVIDSLGALANALGGTQYGAMQGRADAERHADKVIDYSRCPECHSYDISELSGEINQTTNSLEEIKKYKELLDSGILTQEEFDSKKKQLLDL